MIRADSLRDVWDYMWQAARALLSWMEYRTSSAERARRAESDSAFERALDKMFVLDADSGEFTVDQHDLENGMLKTIGTHEDMTEREEIAINAAADAFQAAVTEALGTDHVSMTIQINKREADFNS